MPRAKKTDVSSKNTTVDGGKVTALPETKKVASQSAPVKPRTTPPVLSKYEFFQKEEELFGLIIAKGRSASKGASDIIDEWKVIKNTLNDGNIDLYLAENRLKATALANRAALGISPENAATGVQQLLDRMKE